MFLVLFVIATIRVFDTHSLSVVSLVLGCCYDGEGMYGDGCLILLGIFQDDTVRRG